MKKIYCDVMLVCQARVARMLIASFFLFASLQAISQTTTTFPPLTNCVSNDLSLVSATLTGGDACNSCTAGTTLTRTLTLGINNKTGSKRTAFAFWGTLEITHANGTVTTTSLSRCSGPIPSTGPLPAVHTGGDFGTVTYQCGDALRLTNLYLAWTDASPNSTCPTLNSATINPKCGTLPSITINAGVNGSFTLTNATCTTNGTIQVSPFGGTAPYSVIVNGVSHSGIAAGGSTSFTNLPAATYQVTITDANNCVIILPRTINAPDPIAGPAATVVQPTCAIALGTVNITSPVSGITYTLRQGNTVVHTAVNGVCTGVAQGAYTVTASNGICTTPGDNINMNAQPITPSAPAATVVQPTCAVSTATVNVTSPAAGITYTLKQSGVVIHTAVAGVFSGVSAGTYVLNAANAVCNANGDNVVVNTQPVTPATPAATVGQPTCAVATGTVNVTSPVAGITYTLKQSGVVIHTAVAGVFSAVSAGTYVLNAANATCNANGNNVVVNIQPVTPATPAATVVQPTCAVATGTVNVTSPVAGITYTLKQSAVVIHTAVGGVFSGVSAGTYVLNAANTTCNANGNNVVVNVQPATPATPAATVVQPTCSVGTATVNVTSPVSGVTYTLKQSGNTIHTAVSGVFSTVAAGTYVLNASNGVCNINGNNVVVNAQPETPAKPTVCVVQPSLCGPATGSVTILSPLGAGHEYSVDNGGTWQASPNFPGLAAGSVTGIKVRKNGCISAVATCSDSNCATPARIAQVDEVQEATAQSEVAGFDAYPVPFRDELTIRYKFAYSSPVKIEVFDLNGILLFTRADSKGYAGKEIRLNLRVAKDQLYIVKITTNRGSNFRKIISSK
jgi:methyl coenzyme M reductase subunit C